MKRSFVALLVAVFAVSPAVGRTAASHDPVQAVLAKMQWRSIGPYIGGRVVAVAGVPSDPSRFYMGGVQGGVWESTNYGLSWTNITDGKLPNTAYSIGALAVAPSNPRIIYAGTGEADIRGDFSTGDGVYRSDNAGKTWHYAGLRDTHMTTALAIDPRNPNVVYASSMGHVFVPNPQRGVFKTSDGGKTWHRVLFVNDDTGAATIVMDPHNSRVLYAAMWQAQRLPWKLTSGGPGSGLYKSVDGGAHWTKISTHPGFARGILGKMGVAVSGANPRVVYAIVQAHQGGVFRSNDGGATWKRVNAEMKLRQRAFYYMGIYADPKNANAAYAPSVDGVYKTTDGGRAWKALELPHGDCHIIWINPHDTSILLEGDDGGATVSVDDGATWSSENNQPTGQFYHVAIDDQFPFHVYGAQQDEGAFEGPSASAEGLTLGAWHSVAFGESTFVAPKPGDPDVTFGSGYYSALMRVNTPNGTTKNVSPWPKYMSGASAAETKYRFGWTHPIFFSPAKSNELLSVAQVVFASDDFGRTWRVLSPDLTRNDPRTEGFTGGPIDNDESGAENFPDISALAVSPMSAEVMWAGSADGLVHVTTDGGGHWKLVTPPALPQWARITAIEASHIDKGTAYLAASRYKWDDFHPYVYMTTDYGAHWSAMTTGLPSNQYVFDIRQDPREPQVLAIGARSTAYVSLNGGASWRPLTMNLPAVQVRGVAFDAREGELAVATHGRSFWVLDNLKLLEDLAQSSAVGGAVQLFTPETAWLTHSYGNGPFPTPDTGENPEYGATVFFTIPKSYNGRQPVTLTFKDLNGKTIRSFALHLKNKKEKKLSPDALVSLDHPSQLAYGLRELTEIKPGTNAFTWDLRYAPATEVRGFHMPVADDIDDGVSGPTVLPGSYTVALSYGGATVDRPLQVTLDPREHPAAGALRQRLTLAMDIRDTLDGLNRAINAAMVARPHMTARQRTLTNQLIASVVQMNIHSTEGDLLHQVRLRSYLAFLMNELDGAYDAPTPAETATYNELRPQADTAIAQLDQLTSNANSHRKK